MGTGRKRLFLIRNSHGDIRGELAHYSLQHTCQRATAICTEAVHVTGDKGGHLLAPKSS